MLLFRARSHTLGLIFSVKFGWSLRRTVGLLWHSPPSPLPVPLHRARQLLCPPLPSPLATGHCSEHDRTELPQTDSYLGLGLGRGCFFKRRKIWIKTVRRRQEAIAEGRSPIEAPVCGHSNRELPGVRKLSFSLLSSLHHAARHCQAVKNRSNGIECPNGATFRLHWHNQFSPSDERSAAGVTHRGRIVH